MPPLTKVPIPDFEVTSDQVAAGKQAYLCLCDLLRLSRALLELLAELVTGLHLRRRPQTGQPQATSHPSNGTTQAFPAPMQAWAKLRAAS